MTERLAVLALAGGLALTGCGGGSDEGPGAAPASHEGSQSETEGRAGQKGESVRAEGAEVRGQDGEDGGGRDGKGRSGQDGESIESGSSIVQSTSGGSVTSSASSESGGAIQTFSGTGSSSLTFDVARPSRLVWTNSKGRHFSVSGAGISIDSRAGSGEVALAAGDYDHVRVSGASWTIVVRSR
ncbi:MAG: hypothetical protein M3088_06275 [Actinomycetota bacterium]|nr:hypothetical protein [Actinomycetota bacterium]